MNKQEIIEVFEEFRQGVLPYGDNPFVKTTAPKLRRFLEALIALAEKLPDDPPQWKIKHIPDTVETEYDDH